MPSHSHLAAARDVYAGLKDAVSGILDKAVQDSAELHAAGGTWKLTARRMAFDYDRIQSTVEGMRDAVMRGIDRGELQPPHSTELLHTLAVLLNCIRALMAEARRGIEHGGDLSFFRAGSEEGRKILGSLLGQELTADDVIKARLEEVMEDDFPALYRPDEFIGMKAFYDEQNGVLEELGSQARRLSGGQGISRSDKVKLDKLKRNVIWIRKRVGRALAWYT